MCVCGSKTATKLLKERHLWNAGNNEEGLNTITHVGSGTVCSGTALSHIFIHPWVLRAYTLAAILNPLFLLQYIPCLFVSLLNFIPPPTCVPLGGDRFTGITRNTLANIVQRKTQTVDK